MSTYITVTGGNSALVDRVKQVQATNRESQQQREQDARTVAALSAQTQATEITAPVGGLPNTQVDRRPAAQRQAGGFGLLFYCTYIDAPGSIWSDGTLRDPYINYTRLQATAALEAALTDPTTLEEFDVTVPSYTSTAWNSFNARSPMSGGILKRRYYPLTGREDGPVAFRYGYGGLSIKKPTNPAVTTTITGVVQPKFDLLYSDSLQLNRFPFHCYPSIDGALIVGFGITDSKQTVTVYNGGPTINVGDSIRIAPEWTRDATARSWIISHLIPNLETNYTVTGVSVGATRTVYTLDNLIYDGGASGIPARVYHSYASWADVPLSEVKWHATDSVLAKDLPGGGWNDSNTFDYYIGGSPTLAKPGTLWTLAEMRRVQIPPIFETVVAQGSGLEVPYPTLDAFAIGANETYVVRQGKYTLSNNTDQVLAKTPYGSYIYNPDLAPDTGYEPQDGPWFIQNIQSNYETEIVRINLRQGSFPNYVYYPIEIPFASLAPLLSPGFGNTWSSSETPQDRDPDPPGTYKYLGVRLIA